MDMTCCVKQEQENNLKKPLVANDSLHPTNNHQSNSYGTSADIEATIPSFSSFASLLDPEGHLSDELLNVLDKLFMKYSNGLLIMTEKCLIKYYKDCYPGLSQERHYQERAQYILNKYGKRLYDMKQDLESVLKRNDDDKVEIIDTYTNTNIKRRNEEEETKYNQHIIKSKHHTISINEDKVIIEATLSAFDAAEEEVALFKTKFLLLYRKWCVDKPMMVRLELTCFGFEEFRSGMMIDRTKQLDKIAFNIQQLRNRFNTHKEESKRINNAVSPNECAANIESFIQNNKDPLDINNDTNNLFRKRRPIKFPKICHACCCCCVACIRCCES